LAFSYYSITRAKKMKVGLLRGPYLRANGVLPWEYLHNHSNIAVTAYASKPKRFEYSSLNMPVKELFWPEGYSKAVRFALTKLKFPRNLLFDIKQVVNENDILHVSENYHLFSYQTAKYCKRKRFFFAQGENIPHPSSQNSYLIKHIKRFVNKNAEKITTTTELAKKALIHEGVNDEKIFIVPNATDTNLFTPEPKRTSGTDLPKELETTFNIIFVGRLSEQKGIPWLLDAFKRIKKEDVRLILIGKNVEHFNVRHKHIYHIPYVEHQQLPRIYNLADIGILPSIPTKNNEEQFGQVVHEAMACGKPTLVTNVGGMPEIVTEKTSFVINYKSPQDIKENILYFYQNETEKKRMGQAARQHIEREYTPRIIANKLKRLYHE